MRKQSICAITMAVVLGLLISTSSCVTPAPTPAPVPTPTPTPVPTPTPTPTPVPTPTPTKDTIIIELPVSVSPNKGTIGTEFTITGLGFGNIEPMVRVGEADCTILAHSDTTIRAVLADTLPSGKYAVTIEPGEVGAPAIVVPDDFTVMPPSISPMIPTDVAPLDEVTINGSFFGSKAGEVSVVDQGGQAQNCDLTSWNMESVTFTVPPELYGVYDLIVQNDVGTAGQTRVLLVWESLGADGMPSNGIGAGETTATKDFHVAPEDEAGSIARTGATGIYYGGELWAFFSGEAGVGFRTHVVRYTRLGDKGWEYGSPVTAKVAEGLSLYSPSPVVFNGNLLVFWVDKKTSAIKYSMYGQDAFGKDVWDGPHTLNTTSSGEVSPVYNPDQGRLELYYTSGSKIYWMYTENLTKWNGPTLLKPSTGANSPVTADVVKTKDGKFTVMMAARSPNDEIQIMFARNGTVNKMFSLANIYDETENEHTYFRPFLVNLGYGEVAMLWRGTDNRVNLTYYDVDSEQFHDKYTWPDKYRWGISDYPTCAVGFEENLGSEEKPDALEATLWVFYEGKTNIYSRSQAYLGMWKHVRTDQKDWAEPPKEIEKEIWDLYPVIGIIDMPPFVTNGNTSAEDNKTKIVFDTGTTQTDQTDITLKAGMWIKKDPELGLQIEIHAGLTEQWSDAYTEQKTIEYELTTLNLSQNKMERAIRVFYLAPSFNMIEYHWFDQANQEQKDKIIVVPVVTGYSIRTQLVDPSTNPNFQLKEFPSHEPGNLDTYNWVPPSQQKYPRMTNSGDWTAGSSLKIGLATIGTKVHAEGGYVQIHIGGNFWPHLGFGAEGDFTMSQTITTTVTNSMIAIFDNPAPSVEGDVSHFGVTVFWLEPNDKGFWVPKNRQGSGDKPWFITYAVGDIDYYQP